MDGERDEAEGERGDRVVTEGKRRQGGGRGRERVVGEGNRGEGKSIVKVTFPMINLCEHVQSIQMTYFGLPL